MPRPRSRLGQGLEALVPPLRADGIPSLVPQTAVGAPATGWQIATLERRNGRCTIRFAPANVLDGAKRKRVKVPLLLALGALGASGWELTAVSRGTFYLKRPAVGPAE